VGCGMCCWGNIRWTTLAFSAAVVATATGAVAAITTWAFALSGSSIEGLKGEISTRLVRKRHLGLVRLLSGVFCGSWPS
jgi:hypothetical protein